MTVGIIGTGYVGLVTGACFADKGNKVICVDVDENKINRLRNSVIPIYEPGLEDIVKRNAANGRLVFTTKLADYIDEMDIIFVAVGTPPDENGSADLKYVIAVAKQFGELVNKKTVLVTKSTVPVGTAKKVKAVIEEQLKERGIYGDGVFEVASNPEFLKEGTAVHDFMFPDRVVIGVENQHALNLLKELYKPVCLDNTSKLIITDIQSAEMIKYASNSMLATRISFMNEIANLCEKVGANIDSVRKGMGGDSRIGHKFLYAGCGYGGSCFPKDVKALIKTGKEHGCDMRVLTAVESVNEEQKRILFSKLLKYYPLDELYGKVACVWGLSFKPNTDDMREAPSVTLIQSLLRCGVKIKVTDPVAINSCKKIFGDKVIYCKDKYEAAAGADVIFAVTEWGEFLNTDWEKVKLLAPKLMVVIDGRNMFNRKDIEKYRIYYECIGK